MAQAIYIFIFRIFAAIRFLFLYFRRDSFPFFCIFASWFRATRISNTHWQYLQIPMGLLKLHSLSFAFRFSYTLDVQCDLLSLLLYFLDFWQEQLGASKVGESALFLLCVPLIYSHLMTLQAPSKRATSNTSVGRVLLQRGCGEW